MTEHNHIHLAEGAPAEVDPMSMAAAGLEAPRFPLLAPERIYRFKITSAKVKATKETAEYPESDPRRRTMLELVLATEKDATDTDGRPLRSGYKVFHYIMTSPWEAHEKDGKQIKERTWKNIAEDLGMVLKAIGKGTVSPKALMSDPAGTLENQLVDCKVGIRKGTGSFNDSNTIKFIQPA